MPTALGAVVVIYNVPDATAINLDADTIAGLFAGTIKNWNDPKIAALNSGATLPDLPVTVVHRSDGSGTTNAFTTYLDTVNADWHASVGAGKEVQWPTGIGAQGNDGVAGGVKQTPGAVGYVELNYATQANIPSALVKNAAGKFVAGSTDGVTAAAESAVANFPADFRQAPIINGAGDTTYPIASYTYLLIPVDWSDAEQGAGDGVVHLLGPHRRPVRRGDPRLRAAAGRDPAEVHRGAPQGHLRGHPGLALIPTRPLLQRRPTSPLGAGSVCAFHRPAPSNVGATMTRTAVQTEDRR